MGMQPMWLQVGPEDCSGAEAVSRLQEPLLEPAKNEPNEKPFRQWVRG